jgi:hypothetical protein
MAKGGFAEVIQAHQPSGYGQYLLLAFELLLTQPPIG